MPMTTDSEGQENVLLRVAAIVDSGATGTYNLVLQEVDGLRRLVMAIGLAEAQSIAVFMEGVHLPRPLSHDLMARMVKTFGAEVCEVVIEDLCNGYFIANIICRQTTADGQHYYSFDARTSDAVAFALRSGAPVYARERVLTRLAGPPQRVVSRKSAELTDLPTEELKTMLDEAVEAENYEKAQEIQKILKSRN